MSSWKVRRVYDPRRDTSPILEAHELVKSFGDLTASGSQLRHRAWRELRFLGPTCGQDQYHANDLGCLQPSSGSLSILASTRVRTARDPWPPRRGAQEERSSWSFPVRLNLRCSAATSISPRGTSRARVGTLEFTQLSERANDKVDTCRCMKRRLTIARL